MDGFEVREYEPRDRDGIRALTEEILCREFHVQASIESEEDILDPARAYAPPHGRLIVADSGGEIVGLGGVRRLNERDCELKRLYVLSSRRREGIASALMSQLMRFVEHSGYRRILLEVRPEMRDKVRVYARYGFEAVPEGRAPNPASEWLAIDI